MTHILMRLQEETLKCPKLLLLVCSQLFSMENAVWRTQTKGNLWCVAVSVTRCKCWLKKQPWDGLEWRSVFQHACLTCLLDPDVRWKESSRRVGVFRVAWTAVDREARAFGHHSNTCIAYTGVSRCLQLICAILILMKKKKCLAEASEMTTNLLRILYYYWINTQKL